MNVILSQQQLTKIYEKLGFDESISLNRLVENNIEKFYTTNSQKIPNKNSSYELGLIGEKFVEEQLKQMGLNVINTSKIYHTGDLNVVFEDFIVLVEIKNKMFITADDVTKFKYDINYLEKATDKKVYGLFISLKSDIVQTFKIPRINISETYITINEVLNNSFLKMYFKTINILNSIKDNFDNLNLEPILKLNNSLIEIENEKIKMQNEILQKCLDSKEELITQNNLLENILKNTIPDVNDKHNVINKLKEYVKNEKWTLKEAKEIIGSFAKFKTKNDVLNYLSIIA